MWVREISLFTLHARIENNVVMVCAKFGMATCVIDFIVFNYVRPLGVVFFFFLMNTYDG